MGCYDTVIVKCPECGEEIDFQSKSGPCLLRVYSFEDCPADVMLDINRHSPVTCYTCKTEFYIEYELSAAMNRKMYNE